MNLDPDRVVPGDGLLLVAEAALRYRVAQVTIRQWVVRYDLPRTKDERGRLLILDSALAECDYQRRHWKRRLAPSNRMV